MKRYTETVYLTYDSDTAGTRAALRAVPMLREAGLSAKVIYMKPYKDPDEFIKNLGADAYEERIQNARNSFLFEIDQLMAGVHLEDPDQKAGVYTEIARRLLEFEDELERNVYIDAVSHSKGKPHKIYKQTGIYLCDS